MMNETNTMTTKTNKPNETAEQLTSAEKALKDQLNDTEGTADKSQDKPATNTKTNKEKAAEKALSLKAKFDITLTDKQLKAIFKKCEVSKKATIKDIVDLYIKAAQKAMTAPQTFKEEGTTGKSEDKPSTNTTEDKSKDKTPKPKKQSIREKLFPKEFEVASVKFTRLDDNMTFDLGKQKIEFNFTEHITKEKTIKDYSTAITTILNNLDKLNLHLAIVAAYKPEDFIIFDADKESRYNRENHDDPLPASVQSVPFALIPIVITDIYKTRKTKEIRKILAKNIYTEQMYCYFPSDFFTRTSKGFFKPYDIDFPLELYLVDTSQVKEDNTAVEIEPTLYIDLTKVK